MIQRIPIYLMMRMQISIVGPGTAMIKVAAKAMAEATLVVVALILNKLHKEVGSKIDRRN